MSAVTAATASEMKNCFRLSGVADVAALVDNVGFI